MLYSDRKSKQQFVYRKYKNFLKESILDVGADEMYLKEFLSPDIKYTGIGLGKNPDLIKIDLEKEKIPFPDSYFYCVLCLDVLEHIENIHEVFDDLCRVSKKYVIISLPNPWSDFIYSIMFEPYRKDKPLKFYGLPLEREDDRHKWFFSSKEARSFVEYRANKNNFKVINYFNENQGNKGLPKSLWKRIILAPILIPLYKLFFRSDLDLTEIFESTGWWVLEKN